MILVVGDFLKHCYIFLQFSVSCGYSLVLPYRVDSDEYLQHMNVILMNMHNIIIFLWRNLKNYPSIINSPEQKAHW